MHLPWQLYVDICCSVLSQVVYLTAIFPYALLLILLVKTAMLEGSRNGVIYYLSPNWGHLRSSQVK